MIRAVYQLARPDDAEATLTLTMTVGEWRRLATGLTEAGAYPGWQVASIIRDLTLRAVEHFDAKTETERP